MKFSLESGKDQGRQAHTCCSLRNQASYQAAGKALSPCQQPRLLQFILVQPVRFLQYGGCAAIHADMALECAYQGILQITWLIYD
jgi:hypothetical protein